MRIISIGETLWDGHKDEEYTGGAPFDISVHLNILGHEVYFISAVGSDLRGDLVYNVFLIMVLQRSI